MKRFILTFAALCCSAQAATLTDMVDHIGAYPFQIKMFTRPAFKARVTKLIGKTYYELLDLNTSVQPPIAGNRTVSYFSGNRAHMGGSEEALVVYDSSRDALKIWLKTNHKLMTFEEDTFVNPALFPQDLKDNIQSFYQN